MHSIINTLFRGFRFIYNKIISLIMDSIAPLYFRINKVQYEKGLILKGVPKLFIQGSCIVGENFKLNSRLSSNPIGRSYKSMFVVRKDAYLSIGNNVGMSGITIVCQKSITIGNDVKIGGNVCIYDTDFHALDSDQRKNNKEDSLNTIKREIIIDDDVFIGAHSTILKGVKIGKSSIIGASSKEKKNIPPNQIWAGNPACFIRSVDNEKNDEQ